MFKVNDCLGVTYLMLVIKCKEDSCKIKVVLENQVHFSTSLNTYKTRLILHTLLC